MQNQFQNRKYIIQAIFVFVAFVLILKSMQLQLFDSSFREQANANVVQKINKYPSRGLIFDRNNKLMVNNEAMYDIMVTYGKVKDIDTAKFCRLLNITKEDFEKKLNKNFSDRRYSKSKPFVFLSKISAETFTTFQESLYEFPGFYAEMRNLRGYSYDVGAHVLGYIGEVSQRRIDKEPYYRPGDLVGISGIESAYEKTLRGKRGVEYVLRDNLGRVVGSFEKGRRDTIPESGKDLISSLDVDLQVYAEKLLINKRGALVAIEPETGEILAFASTPSYNPNILRVTRERGKAYAALVQDSTKPLFNRAAAAQYPPGSIFKPVLSLVAMQLGVLDPNRGIGCAGGYHYKNLTIGCHGHPGASNVARAIQHSCNAYFCQVFRDVVDINGFKNPQVGLDTLASYLNKFGLGHRLKTDISNEMPGNVPNSKYYDKIYPSERWYSPYIVSMGIGQGELLATPLQMANLSAIIANRGFYYTPHLTKAFIGDDRQVDTSLVPIEYRTKRFVDIDAHHFEPVVKGMEDVVLAGTARIAQIPGIEVCGKTGTAENPHGEDHSVFIAFAPKENPKIAIAVFVENSGYGARYGAPIASLMIEQYLNGEIKENRKYLEERMFNAVIKYK